MTDEPRILLATSNPHKLDEVRTVLAPLGFTVIGLEDLPGEFEEPVEDADTFAGNSRIKAIEYARMTGVRCLADDSGLVVDALDGAPGVHSARYAGMGSNRSERDEANNAKLLDAIAVIPPERRSARFVCAMCLADPDGTVLAETEGRFEGVITMTPAGANGFGYDPLLYLPDLGCTSAQLTPESKNARSHRGAATRAMVDRIKAM